MGGFARCLIRVLGLFLVLISTTTVVHAQVTSISDLTYPNTVQLFMGSGLVSFTISYSAPNDNGTYYLQVAVLDASTYTYNDGTLLSANPTTCLVPPSYSSAAVCALRVTGSGSEHVQFQVALKINVAGTDNLVAIARLTNVTASTASVITDSTTSIPFTIDVTNP